MQSTRLTFVPLPGGRDLVKWLRANLEWLVAVAVGGMLFAYRFKVSAMFAEKTWNLGAFYAALFDWASIQGAFLFGVYAFFLSRSEPFIQAIAGSQAFRLLRRFVVRTLYLSLALSVLTLPMLVAPIELEKGRIDVGFGAFCFLSILTAYTFMCFTKVIRVFGKIERRS